MSSQQPEAFEDSGIAAYRFRITLQFRRQPGNRKRSGTRGLEKPHALRRQDLYPGERVFEGDWGGPLSRDKQLRHCWPLDEKESTGDTTLAQNDLRLAKRRQALLESNPPRNSQLETRRDDEAGAALSPFPDRFNRAGSKDFPTPEKTHPASCRAAASFCCVRRLASNSAVGM